MTRHRTFLWTGLGLLLVCGCAPGPDASEVAGIPPAPVHQPGPRIRRLIRRLRRGSGGERREAAWTLRKMGVRAAPAAPDLARALQDPNEDVRSEAAWALKEIGPWAEQALVDMLDAARQRGDRDGAHAALGALSHAGERAVPHVVRFLRDHDPRTRVRAVDTLQTLGPDAAAAVPELIRALRDTRLRQPVIWALRSIGPAASDAVPHLVRFLKEGDPNETWGAVHALRSIAQGDEAAAEALLRIASRPRKDAEGYAYEDSLAFEEDFLRREAALTLCRIGRMPKGAIRAFAEGADYEAGISERETFPFAEAMESLAYAGAAVVRDLLEALHDEDPFLREHAAKLLGIVGPPAAPTVPHLAKLLRDPSPAVRANAATALGRIGPTNDTPVAGLVRLLKDPDEEVRYCAAVALATVKPNTPAAAAPLLRALEADRPWGDLPPRTAVPALGRLRPARKEVLAALRRALVREGCEEQAAEALGTVGVPAVAELAEGMRHEHDSVRHICGRSLVRVGAPAVPHLMRALLDGPRDARRDIGDARRDIAAALAYIGRPAVGHLVEGTKHTSADFRRRCAKALGDIGPAARAGAVRLVALLTDKDYGVRIAAAQSLGRIGRPFDAALARHLADAEPATCLLACEALCETRATTPAAIPYLRRMLKDPNTGADAGTILSRVGPEAVSDCARQERAAGAPARLTGPARPCVLDLIASLRYRGRAEEIDGSVRALAAIGEAAVPDLITALRHDLCTIRVGAIRALGEIGPAGEAAVPLLRRRLRRAWATWEPLLRVHGSMLAAAGACGEGLCFRMSLACAMMELIQSALALGKIGPAAQSAAADLAGLAGSRDPIVQACGAWALLRTRRAGRAVAPHVEQAYRQAVSKLAEAAANPWSPWPEAAAEVLGEVGPDAAETAVPALLEGLRAPGPHRETERYVRALTRMGGAAVPGLIQRLKSHDWTVRKEAAEALGEIGPPAKEAAAALEALRRDPRQIDDVRKAAEAALARIRGCG